MPRNIYTRGGWYWARFSVAGTAYREPLRIAVRGRAEERQAERMADERKQAVIAEVRHGKAPPVQWAAAVVGWHGEAVAARLAPATLKRYLVSLAQFRPFLDSLDIGEIDGAVIRKAVAQRRRAGASNATIRRDLTALSRVLAYAVRQEWRRDNPATAFDRESVPERRDPICLPLPHEIAAVIAACPKRFGDMVAFARETGMREEEIASLTHDRVDARRAVAMLYRGKSRRARAVPLNAAALAILNCQPQFLGSPFVFWHAAGARFHNVSSNFSRARRKAAQKSAQWQGFRFHDLRHLFAVEYLRAGGSVYALQQVLGHATIGTTELYLDYLTPNEREESRKGSAQFTAQEQRFGGAGKGLS